MPGLDFDTTTDSVDVGDAPLDDTFVGGGTIMARIVADSFGHGTNFGRIIDKASTTGAALGWAFQLDDPDTLRFEYGWTTTNGNWVTTPTTPINTGTEYHVALSYNDGAVGNNPSIYVDGVLQALTEPSTPAGSAESDAAQTLAIGNIVASAYNRGFDGRIFDVRCYSRILTAAEILDICLLPYPYVPDLVAHWEFAEGAVGTSPSGSNSVKDLANGQSDGTPNSTPVYFPVIIGPTRRRAS